MSDYEHDYEERSPSMSYMKALATEVQEIRNPLLRTVCMFQIGQHVQGKRDFDKLCPTAQRIVRDWEARMMEQLDYERSYQEERYAYGNEDELDEESCETDNNHNLRMQIWASEEALLREEAPELYNQLKHNIERSSA